MPAQAYETVMREIESLIEDKTLAVGDTLAGERGLAEQFRVSRTSVREAIRVLSMFGLVESAPGSGPTSGSRIVSNPDVPFASVMRLHLAADSFDVADLLDARTMLESWAYRKVRGPSEHGAGEINELLHKMAAEPLKEHYLTMDSMLHVEFVRLANNPLLTAMMAALASSVSAYTARAAESIVDWHSATQVLNAEHRAIAEALFRGDGAGAAVLVQQHIAGYARLGGLL